MKNIDVNPPCEKCKHGVVKPNYNISTIYVDCRTEEAVYRIVFTCLNCYNSFQHFYLRSNDFEYLYIGELQK